MKLSVIIPVFNRSKELLRAVNSVLEQLGDDCELIVVDDGSRKPANVFLQTHVSDKRLKITRIDQNRGAANARNVGVENARGEWVSFLDSDDYWLKGRFEQICNMMDESSAGLRVWTTAVIREKNGAYFYHLVDEAEHKKPNYYGGCRTCPGSAMLVRKTTFEAVGKFDTYLSRLEDYEWFLRFFDLGGTLNQRPDATIFIDNAGGGTLNAVSPSVRHIRGKLQTPNRRVEAYLNLELARASMYDKQYLRVLMYLIQSFWCMPRTSLQLQKVKTKRTPDPN